MQKKKLKCFCIQLQDTYFADKIWDKMKMNNIFAADLVFSKSYAFRVYTSLEDIKGNTTESVKFTTSACEPDPPSPPKLANKNKTSIALKWNVGSWYWNAGVFGG